MHVMSSSEWETDQIHLRSRAADPWTRLSSIYSCANLSRQNGCGTYDCRMATLLPTQPPLFFRPNAAEVTWESHMADQLCFAWELVCACVCVSRVLNHSGRVHTPTLTKQPIASDKRHDMSTVQQFWDLQSAMWCPFTWFFEAWESF